MLDIWVDNPNFYLIIITSIIIASITIIKHIFIGTVCNSDVSYLPAICDDQAVSHLVGPGGREVYLVGTALPGPSRHPRPQAFIHAYIDRHDEKGGKSTCRIAMQGGEGNGGASINVGRVGFSCLLWGICQHISRNSVALPVALPGSPAATFESDTWVTGPRSQGTLFAQGREIIGWKLPTRESGTVGIPLSTEI